MVSSLARVGVDIVIPIYNAREFTRQCVASVLEHATGHWRMRLVDDCSTEDGLADDLERFRQRDPRVEVLRNERNEGFVRTANRGMSLAAGRDVLLLNSDTEVFEGFLQRLQSCAHADRSTGVLSPLSNNATICSVPEMNKDNPIPEGFTPASFAALVTACSRQRRPELVTAVGFCMYIKAEVIEQIGLFDEIYGRGFGEENDFCQRAKKAGWAIRLCDDVFVCHKGKASFGPAGSSLEAQNELLLEARQPGYHGAVAEFIEKNPLAPIQESIRFHSRRLGRGRQLAPIVLAPEAPMGPASSAGAAWIGRMLQSIAMPRVVVAWEGGIAEVIGGDLDRPILYDDQLCLVSAAASSETEIDRRIERLLYLFGIRAAAILDSERLLRWGDALQRAELPVVYISQGNEREFKAWGNLQERLVESANADRFPTPEVLRELFDHRQPPPPPAVPPGPRYQRSSWYPAFMRIKPLIPRVVRSWGRRLLVGWERMRS